jgi:uncharacterized protein YlzI (FlbEa/FlbD family)
MWLVLTAPDDYEVYINSDSCARIRIERDSTVVDLTSGASQYVKEDIDDVMAMIRKAEKC